jgi:predicted metal-dependent phosphoesterase TrpH
MLYMNYKYQNIAILFEEIPDSRRRYGSVRTERKREREREKERERDCLCGGRHLYEFEKTRFGVLYPTIDRIAQKKIASATKRKLCLPATRR